jgi:hypothetical protein
MSTRAKGILLITLASLWLNSCRDAIEQNQKNGLSLDERLLIESAISGQAGCIAVKIKATDTAYASRDALDSLRQEEDQPSKFSAILVSLKHWANTPSTLISFPHGINDLEYCRNRWLLELNRPVIMGKYAVIYYEIHGCKFKSNYDILERTHDGWIIIRRLAFSGPSPITCDDPDWTDEEIRGFVPLPYTKPASVSEPSIEPMKGHFFHGQESTVRDAAHGD